MKKPTKIIYLEREVFEHDLQYHLTIISYPEKKNHSMCANMMHPIHAPKQLKFT